ncbi:uncharacterized protein LOC110176159 [Drosophila serrata]|uniref:uncharacterized protein LOC110176159 n=1 Tax=Drosophila serrata TaxID=7274 RepID=UPI000A1CFDBE|nr:uncharacterized protein LOC110176159 [Drosophila serrata]
MRALFVSSLIVFLGVTLISSKPLKESKNRDSLRLLTKSQIAEMIENSKLLEKLAKETYFGKLPTSEETYKTKDPTTNETYQSKEEETHFSKDPTDDKTYLSKDPTAEQTKDATGVSGKDEEELVVEEDDEDEDEATVDKPTDAVPLNFLNYPEHVEDFKPYPRFAILRNGYVHHMNLDF